MSNLISSGQVGDLNFLIHSERDGVRVEVTKQNVTERRILSTWAQAEDWVIKKLNRALHEINRD